MERGTEGERGREGRKVFMEIIFSFRIGVCEIYVFYFYEWILYFE